MRSKLLLLASVALLGLSVSAKAADLTFNVTGGTLSPSGSFSGSFQINSATEFVDGGSFVATAPSGGTTYTFTAPPTGTTVPGLALFSDGFGDTFRLALNGSITTLQLNTLASNGANADTALILATGLQFNATGGTVAAPSAPTPEPSSLALLGTGALGLFGAARRRFAA